MLTLETKVAGGKGIDPVHGGVKVPSYGVMTNHFHLLLEVHRHLRTGESGISEEELIHRLGGLLLRQSQKWGSPIQAAQFKLQFKLRKLLKLQSKAFAKVFSGVRGRKPVGKTTSPQAVRQTPLRHAPCWSQPPCGTGHVWCASPVRSLVGVREFGRWTGGQSSAAQSFATSSF